MVLTNFDGAGVGFGTSSFWYFFFVEKKRILIYNELRILCFDCRVWSRLWFWRGMGIWRFSFSIIILSTVLILFSLIDIYMILLILARTLIVLLLRLFPPIFLAFSSFICSGFFSLGEDVRTYKSWHLICYIIHGEELNSFVNKYSGRGGLSGLWIPWKVKN